MLVSSKIEEALTSANTKATRDLVIVEERWHLFAEKNYNLISWGRICIAKKGETTS
jgi:hypothetical protein